MLPAIGYAAGTYGGITLLTSLSTAINNEVLANTRLNDHHLITVHYKTFEEFSSAIEEYITKEYKQKQNGCHLFNTG